MANGDRPMGFRPQGAPMKTMTAVAGAAIYPGDFVKLSADGKVDPVAAGDDIYGCALSYASAEDVEVLISCDPNQLYIGQCDGADIDAQTDIGNNADVLATAGDSTYKVSRMEVDSDTQTAAGSAQLTILRIDTRPDNALGANVDVVVRINEHQLIGENDSSGV